jgi:septal ring factor EnvC (AmiA/AmiB activator)
MNGDKETIMTEWFKDLKGLLTELNENISSVKANAERVQIELKKAERTSQDIQRKVTEFQVSAQPKIDKINEQLENINQINKKTN